MRPSQYRSLLTFKERVTQADDEGGVSVVENAKVQAWGNVGNASGSESYVAEQLRSQVEFTIEMARNAAVKADMIVTDRLGRVMEVIGAPLLDDDHPRTMRVLCRQYREKREA